MATLSINNESPFFLLWQVWFYLSPSCESYSMTHAQPLSQHHWLLCDSVLHSLHQHTQFFNELQRSLAQVHWPCHQSVLRKAESTFTHTKCVYSPQTPSLVPWLPLPSKLNVRTEDKTVLGTSSCWQDILNTFLEEEQREVDVFVPPSTVNLCIFRSYD